MTDTFRFTSPYYICLHFWLSKISRQLQHLQGDVVSYFLFLWAESANITVIHVHRDHMLKYWLQIMCHEVKCWPFVKVNQG